MTTAYIWGSFCGLGSFFISSVVLSLESRLLGAPLATHCDAIRKKEKKKRRTSSEIVSVGRERGREERRRDKEGEE